MQKVLSEEVFDNLSNVSVGDFVFNPTATTFDTIMRMGEDYVLAQLEKLGILLLHPWPNKMAVVVSVCGSRAQCLYHNDGEFSILYTR